MDIPTIVTLISVALAIGTFFIGRISAGHENGKEAGAMQTDIKYIKASIDRIEKNMDRDMSKMDGRVGQVADDARVAKSTADEALQSAKSAHKRLDQLGAVQRKE